MSESEVLQDLDAEQSDCEKKGQDLIVEQAEQSDPENDREAKNTDQSDGDDDSKKTKGDGLKEGSMTIQELNNLVVGMRGAVKKSKTSVINTLTRTAAAYKKRKGSEAVVEKYKRKADRIIEELSIVKELDPKMVAKYCLAEKCPPEETLRKTTSSRFRVLARLACHKDLRAVVTKFRGEHSDWESLSLFLLTKNTGRRFKKKKKPDNDGAESGSEESDSKTEQTPNSDQAPKSDSKREQTPNADQAPKKEKDSKRKRKPRKSVKEIRKERKAKARLGRKQRAAANEDELKPNSEHSGDEASATEKLSAAPKLGKQRQSTPRRKTKPESNIELANDVANLMKQQRDNLNYEGNLSREGVIQRINLEDLANDDKPAISLQAGPISAAAEGEACMPISSADGFFVHSGTASGGVTQEWPDDISGDERHTFGRPAVIPVRQPVQHKSFQKERFESNRRQPQSDSRRWEAPPSRNKTFNNSKMMTNPSKGNFKSRTEAPVETEVEKLHPSWEASRKRKLQQAQITGFSGKRKTFDDSD